MLDTIFIQVLDMSKTASIVILAVLLARLLLKKAPKVFSYALWAVVLFRLLCPFSWEAPVSVVPEMTSISESYTLAEEPISVLGAGEAAYQAVGDALNGGLGIQHIRTTETDEAGMTRYVTTDWWSVWILFGQYVWAAGVGAMLLYSVVSYRKIRRKLLVVVPLRDNVYLADDIRSPFVAGLFRPKIYLPCNLAEKEQEYIILHEQHHIKRCDHVIKLVAFFALAIHWFNPLVWMAFVLAGKDMEMSCDEAVIRRLGSDVRAEYSASLLTLATGRRIIAGTPLAFGEGDTKGRILNLAKWKKPAVWVVIAGVIACVVLAACLMTDNPSEDNPAENLQIAGKTYIYEKEGIIGDFTITLNEDGTFTYYEGMASSYIGRGIWVLDGEILTMTDDGSVGYPFVNRFRIDGEDLIFMEWESSNFIYVKVQDGERFHSGETGSVPESLAAYADLDHDGINEEIMVRETEKDWLYELSVVENGVVLWSKELSTAHAGWGTLLLYHENGQDYLVEYNPYMNTGLGGYTCTVFSFANGEESVKQKWSVQFKTPTVETAEMKAFAEEVGLLLQSCTVLLSTEQSILVDRPTEATALPQIYPVRFDPAETQAAIDGITAQRELTVNAAKFPDAPLTFQFTRGTDAWSTLLTLQPDGSFTGTYRDTDVEDNNAEYPNGTCHICEFSCRFTDIQQISDFVWLMKLSELSTGRPRGEVWIEDQILYVAAEPFGLIGGKEFLLYAPGTPAEELTEGARSWWPDAERWRSGETDRLSGWGLYGISSGAGFFTSWLTMTPW